MRYTNALHPSHTRTDVCINGSCMTRRRRVSFFYCGCKDGQTECLGLFRLTAQQRTKEIGIRKTLGASIESLVFLLSRSYGKLVLIAFIVATPLSWYAVHLWLQSYSYQANIGIMIYVLASVAAFLIAMLTIGYQCVRAASANPAQSLRSE